MKFAAIVLLFLGLPAFAEVGEKYADIEKRLGPANMRWVGDFGVIVYCHGPKTLPMPSTLEGRIQSYASKGTLEYGPRLLRDVASEQYQQLHKREREQRRPDWMCAYVVQGVCLAEEYFPANLQGAIEVVRRQRKGNGMGEPTPLANARWVIDWSAEDGRTARYSSWSNALMVIHPQWQGVDLKARLNSPGICGIGFTPVKSELERLLEDKPWIVKEPEPALRPLRDENNPGEVSDSLLLPQ